MVALDNRRAAVRYPLEWQVCLWHDQSKRFFTGRSTNISSTGAMIRLPLTVPLTVDQRVELNFPSPGIGQNDRHPASIFSARVVRINRPQSILEGQQVVAVQFT